MNLINQRSATTWQNRTILFLMLFFTGFWSFKAYDGIPRYVLFFVTYLALFMLLQDRHYLQGKTMASNVNLIVVSFFLSCIPSIFVFGQELYAALAGILMVLSPILLYYLLHKWNISEDKLYKYLIIFTIIFAFISIFQQFTYPTYWFGGREENEISGMLEQRMGFWRFYLFGINYCVLAYLLTLNKILKGEGYKKTNYLLFLICCVAIYFFLARKNIYAAISCIAFAVLFSQGNTKTSIKVLFVILLVAAYLFLSFSMSDLNMQSSEELGENSEDFIRFLAAEHFMYDFSDSPWYYALGSGIPGGDNALQRNISYLIDTMHFYQDDCGFIGYFSRFGLFGLLMQILVMCKIFVNRKYVDLGLLLFVVFELEISFFDFLGNNTRNMAAWSIFLYLVDKNIENNRTKIEMN